MRIGFASNDWAMKALDENGHPTWGGSGWARCGLPAKYLALRGHEVFTGTLIARGTQMGVRPWDGTEVYGFDVLVLQRWMFADIVERTRAMRANGQIVVQDLDDWFWGLDPRNNAFRASHPRLNTMENRDHYRRVVAAASVVTVSTPYLADRVRSMFGGGVRVEVLENHVEVDRFVPREVRDTPFPVIGWIGATPWRSGDLETLRGVLGPFLERHDLRAYHGGDYPAPGAPSFAEQAGVDVTRVDFREMVPITHYPELFEHLDVGLVPLADRPFNRAKSAIKGLEYAAAGIPFIAQALPNYVDLYGDGLGIGRIAERPKDWLRHLKALLDPEQRAEDRARNLERVKAYDIGEGVAHWEGLYRSLNPG